MASSGGHWKKGGFVGGGGGAGIAPAKTVGGSSLFFPPGVTYDDMIKGISPNSERVLGFYDPRTGELKLAKGRASTHDYLAGQIDKKNPASVGDANVHITVNMDKGRVHRITFNSQQAGAGTNDSRGMKNVYKAMDKLKSRGFPEGTSVAVYTLGPTVRTSI